MWKVFSQNRISSLMIVGLFSGSLGRLSVEVTPLYYVISVVEVLDTVVIICTSISLLFYIY